MINELRLHYPVPFVKRVLSVSASGYYSWQDRPLSKRDREEMRLELEIKAAHRRTRQTYGPERLQHDLAENGVRVGICRIKRIRKKLGLRCKQKRKFKVTTDSRHGLPVTDNLLDQHFKVYEPNKVWLSDITYIPTDEGWLYLAGHKDIFNGEIVGYAMGERLSKNLINQSLFRAVTAKRPPKGLLHHSDRGSQYCSYEYRQLLQQLGVRVSMSGKGNCYDNAPMESFWGTLKQELIHHRHYTSRRQAMQEITEYIEIFYNRQRLQAKLGFLSPAPYIKRFYAGLLAA
jgi:transposase InsO family protein